MSVRMRNSSRTKSFRMLVSIAVTAACQAVLWGGSVQAFSGSSWHSNPLQLSLSRKTSHRDTCNNVPSDRGILACCWIGRTTTTSPPTNGFKRSSLSRSSSSLFARSICIFDDTDFAGAAGDAEAFQSSVTINFNRLDNSQDAKFYREPRFVQHVDEAAVEALTKFYESEFADSYSNKNNNKALDILDLCSSWTCHFPEAKPGVLEYERVVGLGMNSEELSANPFVTETIVHDLNQEPRLTDKLEDASFDIITMALSVDYLTQPLNVFQEIHRLLRPGGGKALISFSNRCFPTKAIATWLQGDDLDRLTLVASYFHYGSSSSSSSSSASSSSSSSAGWSLLEALDLKDATQELPKRPSAQAIFSNPAVGLAWMNSASAVQRRNAGDPLFVVKAVKL